MTSQLTPLLQVLSKMESAMLESDRFSYEGKLIMVADMSLLKVELTKPKPNPEAIEKSWRIVERVMTIGGLLNLVRKANPYIKNQQKS